MFRYGPVYPGASRAVESDTIMMESHELRVLRSIQGDRRNSTALSVTEIRALLPGDLVFKEVHPWPGEHDLDALSAWPGLVADAASFGDLQAQVRAAFPSTIDVLDDFILVNSIEVAMGEQPIWTE